mmetsp:Transcript_26357/g.102839  ORF Transcript_26357/g.102839 Transcript_26357/m.102839 type:complete len:107 (-) Transcript_26357:599-919(-)|eukprot:CAMPEP_0113953898 /NCGR_PEP_ID=MMETSP0011_2-20120614/111_1 /TAXON_ID=101924 /ORGANISM="Rhodosorus marinus" /LENGTH=106 /DNA_ID=CAMNT_0000962683 /DNA_START=150 /DNA_END=470 /DNA_ORIENTATION=- /assembly_acc=CAM_ASM_000156
MKDLVSIEKSLKLETLREDVALAEEHAIRLEDKHHANEDVKKQLQKTEEKDTWLCIGKESFLKLSKEKAIDELRKQSLALWAEIEQTQEVVTIKKGQLDDLVEVEE